MRLDDLKSDVTKFIRGKRKLSNILKYIELFAFNSLCRFEADIFNAEYDKKRLYEIANEMSQFRQQFTQFCIMIRDAVPGLIKSEQIKKYDERIMYNLQMISMILHVPDRKPDINNLFVLQWFELQFIKYMSYVEERCKNLRWNIRLSSKYERDIYKQELLAVCEDYKKKDKYFNGLMDQFERGEVEYKGVKIYPKKDEVKQLSDFKSRIRIWSVKLESIRTKYCEDHEEENEEKKE